jgi:hypothetical protein
MRPDLLPPGIDPLEDDRRVLEELYARAMAEADEIGKADPVLAEQRRQQALILTLL